MTATRRHVLVVASQCASEEELAGLGEISTSLRDIFLDPDIGCCTAGLPDGVALLSGQLAAADIAAKIGESIEYAASNGATLVLAVLGHGFIPGNDPTLYFMGWNSAAGNRNSAVNISEYLLRAADTPGIKGVTGIVDTCTAAAAVPGMPGLSAGTLNGQTQLSLVMASGVDQPAFEMSLSQSLVRLLRSGVPGAGPLLQLSSEAFAAELRAALPGQNPVIFYYDGAAAGDTPWLARNRHTDSDSPSLGPYGATELATALAALHPGREFPATWDGAALHELQRELAALPASPARTRAERLVDSLRAAHETVSFLRSFMPAQLSTQGLRRAVAAIACSSGSPVRPARVAEIATEVDAAEYVALSYPRAERTCRPQLTRFVLELASDAGFDLDSPQLRAWAVSIDALVAFNDALKVRRQRHSERRLRLIVSLHYAPTGDWPEALGAWLLYDGESYQHKDIDCTPDQPGAEKALADAVDWAEEHAETLGVPLQRIEVAVPVRMILRWRPEEVLYGPRLGVDYEVLTRWSQRLEQRPAMHRINRSAARRLAEIAACVDGSRLHWLTAQQVGELSRLLEELRNGRYTRAIGLVEHPGENERLFEVLLQFVPILIWPLADRLSLEHQDMVDAQWDLLPTAFLVAYRARWRDEDGGPMADIRAVWDDEDWLSFCRDLRIQPGTTEE